MGDTKLLPCPFCGGEAVSENYVIEAAAFCKQCRAKIIRSHGARDDNGLPEAIAAWNARPALLARQEGEDAERYRWLRAEHAVNSPLAHVCWKQDYNRQCGDWVNTASPDSLDAAIDAARSGGGG